MKPLILWVLLTLLSANALGSPLYRFSQLDLVNDEGNRHYRVWLGVPDRPAPAQGYPVVYMLDGNAVREALDPPTLAGLDANRLPVLVLLGYPVKDRFDVPARTFDYTPLTPAGSGCATGQPGGGADAFAAFIQTRVKPTVAAHVRLDPARQTLWGHSFGGLFAVHVLLTHPEYFQAYAVADPSLWWGQGVVLGGEARFAPRQPLRLLMMRGMAPSQGKGPPGAGFLPPNAAYELVKRLATRPQVSVQYREWPLGHGAMFNAALVPGLRFAQGT